MQDQSELRRGEPTLHSVFGIGIAINVGSMTNLIGLHRLLQNRSTLGDGLTLRILGETELMMRHSLEGQAIELGWIRENRVNLTEDDYYRMCLKKTSWYTCVYPCRLGALIAKGGAADLTTFDRYSWYLGAAFQIQDDILNLVGRYDLYGKEIAGDLWEGKRTLILIHLLRSLRGADRSRLTKFLGLRRAERDPDDVAWVAGRIEAAGSIEHARRYAAQLAAAAELQAVAAFGHRPPSDARELLLALPRYVIERDH